MSLIEEAVQGADLGDSRRNERALLLVASIAQGQTSDTNAAPGTAKASPWAHSMGACRFYNNAAVTLPQLYGMMRTALQALVAPTERCYIAHDFSVVDYTKHNAKKDRTQVGNESGAGYDLYTGLVLDAFGRPLGPLSAELRNSEGCRSSESCEILPFVDHYSQVERSLVAATSHLAGREIVHLMDREFDDVALLRFLEGQHGLYVIRAKHLARVVNWRGQPIKLEALSKALPRVRSGEVERDGKRYERWISETVALYDRPSCRGRHRGGKPKKGPSIEVRIVVTELRGIGHTEHFEWVLLTNLADRTEDVVAAYLARWRIERFFYLAKVGLRLESWRQETAEAIARRLAITMLAAMVIYQLLIAKDDPTVRTIAKLGGWLGRKHDHLGPVVMMRGVLVMIAALSAIAQYGVAQLVQMAEEAGLGFAVAAKLRGAAGAAAGAAAGGDGGCV